MANVKEKKKQTDISSLLGLGLTSAMTGFLIGEVMNKMDGLFGSTEKIPKGVVKEMMEGVVEGLLNSFEMRLFNKEEEVKQAKSQILELEQKLEIVTEELEKVSKKK